jgi:hypothetical protein
MQRRRRRKKYSSLAIKTIVRQIDRKFDGQRERTTDRQVER